MRKSLVFSFNDFSFDYLILFIKTVIFLLSFKWRCSNKAKYKWHAICERMDQSSDTNGMLSVREWISLQIQTACYLWENGPVFRYKWHAICERMDQSSDTNGMLSVREWTSLQIQMACYLWENGSVFRYKRHAICERMDQSSDTYSDWPLASPPSVVLAYFMVEKRYCKNPNQ